MKILTREAEKAIKEAIVVCLFFGIIFTAIGIFVYAWASAEQGRAIERNEIAKQLNFGSCTYDTYFFVEGWRCANQTHECLVTKSSIVKGKYFVTECEAYKGGGGQ